VSIPITQLFIPEKKIAETMDVYTTSFTYPRRSPSLHSPASSLDFQQSIPDSYNTSHQQQQQHLQQQQQQQAAKDVPAVVDPDAVQKLALMAMSIHNCHVAYYMVDQGRAWNFYITGVYQQVMLARGLILKECPIQVRLFHPFHLSHFSFLISPLFLILIITQHRAAIKVTRSEILDSPFSKPTLKPEVRRRLDDIASQTQAHIAVVNSPHALSSRTPPDGINSSAGWSGLETERVCELQVTGLEDAVDLARVRLLVMLDELVRTLPSLSRSLTIHHVSTLY